MDRESIFAAFTVAVTIAMVGIADNWLGIENPLCIFVGTVAGMVITFPVLFWLLVKQSADVDASKRP